MNPKDEHRYLATIGFFDGVHRGHQYLIQQMMHCAAERGLEPLLITFDQHPRRILSLDYVPRLLSTLPEKLDLLRRFCPARVEVLPFTKSLSQLSAIEFMRKILVGEMKVASLVMGYDHRFGHGGGSMEEYFAWGKECGLEVILANPLPGEKVSSSLIRKLLEAGNVSESNRLLGYAYPIMGEVITGHHVGRELGFPTANLSVESEKLLPARGVYAVWVELLNGARYRGVLNIGRRPTLHNGEDLSVEVHLLGFTGNIYAERLRLELVTRMRDEQTFDDTEQLRQQIAADCKLAEEILKLR